MFIIRHEYVIERHSYTLISLAEEHPYVMPKSTFSYGQAFDSYTRRIKAKVRLQCESERVAII